MSEKQYTESFKIFKPRKTKDGCASQWQLNKEKQCVFLEFANQNKTDENTFDWQNKTTMKLGISDIGEILATFLGMQDGIGLKDEKGRYKGLYHQTSKGNTILQLAKGNNGGYFIRLSGKLNEEKEAKVYQHAITFGEAAVLRSLLNCAVERIYEW